MSEVSLKRRVDSISAASAREQAHKQKQIKAEIQKAVDYIFGESENIKNRSVENVRTSNRKDR